MRILQVLSTLSTGGAETFTIGLANELAQLGHKCDIVTLFDVPNGNDLLNKVNSNVCHYSLNKRTGFDIGCYRKLYLFIKKGKYDVVHAHVGAIPYILLATILLRNVKFVATIHSEAKREAGNAIKKWSRFYMFRHNKCIPVTISEESKKTFDKYYKMNSSMVYNGSQCYSGKGVCQLKDNDEQILFLHVARCERVKNQELLIKAFAKLVTEYPNIKMIWLGSYTNNLSLFNSLLPLMPDQFKYVGSVANVRDYLIQADAMCLASKMEGMPMSIIEAFSVGTPSLCTPVGGIINMISDGENGMLSSGLSVEDYYLMLKRFCNLSFKEKEMMRMKASASFAKYSIANTAKGYLEIYNSK